MSRFRPARSAVLSGVLFALLCGLVAGCGDEKTYRVSGKVTFKGQPIPAGMIYFTPDKAKGNAGSGGYAPIKDGSYDTDAPGGRGTVCGPTIIRIEAVDPTTSSKSEKSGDTITKALFPPYETVIDLPKQENTKDIDVPADAVKGSFSKKKGPGP